MNQKKKRLLALAGAAAFLCLMLLFGRYAKGLLSDADGFAAKLRGMGTAGQAVMVVLVVAQVLLAVVPGGPFQIAAGYVYGPVRGTLLCLLGSTIGSVITFFLVRKYGRGVIALFCGGSQMKTLDRIMESPRWKVLLPVIFVIPGSPKDLLSYAAGLTDVPVPVWLLIASLGRLPAILLSAISGNAVQEANYETAAAVMVLICVISAAGGVFFRQYTGAPAHVPEDPETPGDMETMVRAKNTEAER